MRDWNKISRIEDGVEIPGMSTPVFIRNGWYIASEINVYQDGLISCWDLVDLEGFKQKIMQGWVVTTLPDNALVSIARLGRFRATEVQAGLKEEEFIKEVADVIEMLNGRPTSMDKCAQAFQRFQEEQSEAAIQQLGKAWQEVPEHLRWFVLQDLDTNIDIEAALSALQKRGL